MGPGMQQGYDPYQPQQPAPMAPGPRPGATAECVTPLPAELHASLLC